MSIKEKLTALGIYVGEEFDPDTGTLILIRYPNGMVCAHSPYVAAQYADWLGM